MLPSSSLLSVYASVIGNGELERTTSLFFGFLLPVLIVLDDPYRPVTQDSQTATSTVRAGVDASDH